MHLPAHMLKGAICPVTVIVCIVGIVSALFFVKKFVRKE